MRTYLAKLWLALDILLNTLLGGDVETISSRMGRALKEGRRCLLCGPVCWLLSRFWPSHCVNNIMTPVNK
jgi:hypothetical protein